MTAASYRAEPAGRQRSRCRDPSRTRRLFRACGVEHSPAWSGLCGESTPLPCSTSCPRPDGRFAGKRSSRSRRSSPGSATSAPPRCSWTTPPAGFSANSISPPRPRLAHGRFRRVVLADPMATLLPTLIRRTHGSPPSPAPLRPEDTGRGSGIFSAGR